VVLDGMKPVDSFIHALLVESASAGMLIEPQRLVQLGHAILEGKHLDWDVNQALPVVLCTAGPTLARVKAGELPAAALGALAGLGGFVQLGDYGMNAFWNIAVELLSPIAGNPTEGTLLTDEQLQSIAEVEANHGAEAADVLRTQLEEQAAHALGERAERRTALLQLPKEIAEGMPELAKLVPFQDDELPEIRLAQHLFRRRRLTNAPSDHKAWADRIGPMGISVPRLDRIYAIRPLLWLHRSLGVTWEALCMAVDTIGGCSFASLDRLGSLATGNPSLPSLLWLDEIACRIAGEHRRAARRTQEFDAWLGMIRVHDGERSEPFASAVQDARALFTENASRIHDAWLSLAAEPPPEMPRVKPMEELPLVQHAAIRRLAKRGNADAKDVLELEEVAGELLAAERGQAELLGPFHEMKLLPEAIAGVLDPVLKEGMIAFRQLYGIELLRVALPMVEEALGGER
jgi:hypothetical protein